MQFIFLLEIIISLGTSTLPVIINPMRIIALLAFISLVSTLQLTQSHEYWFNKNKPSIAGNSNLWYYCNAKCLFLENLLHGTDFVVIEFTAPLRDTFSACYVRTPTGYILWNKVISNKFFAKNCGNDHHNWIKNPLFKIKSIIGEGKAN